MRSAKIEIYPLVFNCSIIYVIGTFLWPLGGILVSFGQWCRRVANGHRGFDRRAGCITQSFSPFFKIPSYKSSYSFQEANLLHFRFIISLVGPMDKKLDGHRASIPARFSAHSQHVCRKHQRPPVFQSTYSPWPCKVNHAIWRVFLQYSSVLRAVVSLPSQSCTPLPSMPAYASLSIHKSTIFFTYYLFV